MNETLDPQLRSWVEPANDPEGDFAIQNLPLGVYRRGASKEAGRIGIAIGDQILDLASATGAAPQATLNGLMAEGPDALHALRSRVSELLRYDAAERGSTAQAFVPMRDAELLLPVHIPDYTDFYASLHHATNVGRLFRPDQPLLPNYKYVPIGYHGRASSVVVSGTPVVRPKGQSRPQAEQTPEFGPTRRLDYELEVGFLVGTGNVLGRPIPMAQAARHIFGFCLVNDWSARDIQAWEYQPLGPFLSKSFATTISPWVVTAEALAPFRTTPPMRAEGDPAPLEYLRDEEDLASGAFDITLEVWIETESMRQSGLSPVRLSRGNFRDLYWTVAQMVAHHSSNGCNLRSGDLLASGTVSGPTPEARGCLLELTRGGADPIALPNGEMRRFLEDGDEVILRGRCERPGFTAIGFGECRGRVYGQLSMLALL